MLIHIVKLGDTLYRIALLYHVSVSRIISDNGLIYPYTLVTGQALIITKPTIVHTVKAGDSLYSIALRYGITVQELYQNNPQLADRNPIYPNQVLTIAFEGEKERGISVNGYAYPFVNRHVLRRTLPYLTYLSIFSYGFRPDGTLLQPDDEELIRYARTYQAEPILVLTSIDESGTFSSANTSRLLTDLAFQNKVLSNLIALMQKKGYRGMDSDFEYIPTEEADAYVAFLQNAHQQLSAVGLYLHCALAPKTSGEQAGLLYAGHRYQEIGAIADRVLLMTYEWGYTYARISCHSGKTNTSILDHFYSKVQHNSTQFPNFILLSYQYMLFFKKDNLSIAHWVVYNRNPLIFIISVRKSTTMRMNE